MIKLMKSRVSGFSMIEATLGIAILIIVFVGTVVTFKSFNKSNVSSLMDSRATLALQQTHAKLLSDLYRKVGGLTFYDINYTNQVIYPPENGITVYTTVMGPSDGARVANYVAKYKIGGQEHEKFFTATIPSISFSAAEGRILVKVTQELTGAAVSGVKATASLAHNGTEKPFCVTNFIGECLIVNVGVPASPDVVNVSVNSAGSGNYFTLPSPRYTKTFTVPTEAGVTKNLDFVLRGQKKVFVEVEDRDGNPVEGAWVHLWPKSTIMSDLPWYPGTGLRKTDEFGIAHYNLVPGEYWEYFVGHTESNKFGNLKPKSGEPYYASNEWPEPGRTALTRHDIRQSQTPSRAYTVPDNGNQTVIRLRTGNIVATKRGNISGKATLIAWNPSAGSNGEFYDTGTYIENGTQMTFSMNAEGVYDKNDGHAKIVFNNQSEMLYYYQNSDQNSYGRFGSTDYEVLNVGPTIISDHSAYDGQYGLVYFRPASSIKGDATPIHILDYDAPLFEDMGITYRYFSPDGASFRGTTSKGLKIYPEITNTIDIGILSKDALMAAKGNIIWGCNNTLPGYPAHLPGDAYNGPRLWINAGVQVYPSGAYNRIASGSTYLSANSRPVDEFDTRDVNGSLKYRLPPSLGKNSAGNPYKQIISALIQQTATNVTKVFSGPVQGLTKVYNSSTDTYDAVVLSGAALNITGLKFKFYSGNFENSYVPSMDKTLDVINGQYSTTQSLSQTISVHGSVAESLVLTNGAESDGDPRLHTMTQPLVVTQDDAYNATYRMTVDDPAGDWEEVVQITSNYPGVPVGFDHVNDYYHVNPSITSPLKLVQVAEVAWIYGRIQDAFTKDALTGVTVVLNRSKFVQKNPSADTRYPNLMTTTVADVCAISSIPGCATLDPKPNFFFKAVKASINEDITIKSSFTKYKNAVEIFQPYRGQVKDFGIIPMEPGSDEGDGGI